MLDRIMATIFLVGGVSLAAFLYHDRYAAPGCRAAEVTGAVVAQIKERVGTDGLYLVNVRSKAGEYFSAVRKCSLDAAPITALQPLGDHHWHRVVYDVRRDRVTGAVAVTADLGGAALPTFAENGMW